MADAAEILLRISLELGHSFRIDIGRIGIRMCHHVLERGIQVFVIVEIFALAKVLPGVKSDL